MNIRIDKFQLYNIQHGNIIIYGDDKNVKKLFLQNLINYFNGQWIQWIKIYYINNERDYSKLTYIIDKQYFDKEQREDIVIVFNHIIENNDDLKTILRHNERLSIICILLPETLVQLPPEQMNCICLCKSINKVLINSLYNFYFTAYEKKLFEALIEKFVVDNEILIHNNNFHWFF